MRPRDELDASLAAAGGDGGGGGQRSGRALQFPDRELCLVSQIVLAGRRSLQPLAAAGSHGDRFDKFRVVTDGRGIGHLFWLGTGLTLGVLILGLGEHLQDIYFLALS